MSDPAPCTPTVYGPCAPYATLADVVEGCGCAGLALSEVPPEGEGDPTPGADVALLEQALGWASRRVFMATGYRFWGCCSETIRPCRTTGSGFPAGAVLPPDWPWASWPWPSVPVALDGERWVNVWACGCSAGAPCSCSAWDLIPLPYLPARDVLEVKIGGDVLDPSAYRVRAAAWLERIDGEPWPSCQASAPLGEPGTWSVTYRHGLDLPPEAVPLVAAYACQLAKRCKGGECALPEGVRVVQRDGVEFAVMEPADYRDRGLTGFGPVDDWISLLNGGHVTDPPRIYRPGREPVGPLGAAG